MNDQPTRAREPEADPRQPFTLPLERAQALALAIVEDGHDDSRPNVTQFWVETGEAMGFTWNTVQDVVGEFEGLDPKGDVTFTAWALPAAWQPDPDALAWLDAMVVEGDTGTLKNRELILRAWASGRDTGFAMGSATAQANRPGLGWDGMELLKESAELLRFYESSHLAKVERLVASGARDPDTEAAVDDTRRKAERNAAQAAKLEAFLADPTQSHLVHDGLREARDDSATAALAGWHAAMLQVRELVESGAWWPGSPPPSGIPPLVLLDRLGELPPPDDMDEVFQRLRDPMAQVERLRVALREWFDKSEWVREAVNAGIPQKLGMKPQWGRHYADTAREMVERLNALLAGAIAGTLVGLRVQAAADVLKAMGFTAEPQPVPGVYSERQGVVLEPEETHDGVFPGDADCGGSAAMLGAIHGKEG